MLPIVPEFADGVADIFERAVLAIGRAAQRAARPSCGTRVPDATQGADGAHVDNPVTQERSQARHVHLDELEILVYAGAGQDRGHAARAMSFYFR